VPLPVITDELIQALDQVFPNRCPDLSLSDREVWYRSGQRYVVDYLIEQQLRQKETMLTETILEN
tara:strand:- start:1216 stop:1410 length:195 start_codon:yes stop_codon:yes gene_type:complete